MAYNAANPLIVQSDKSLLLEVNNDHYEEARNWLARFAELIIYDKVHLLPAPVFRITAEIQARRRLVCWAKMHIRSRECPKTSFCGRIMASKP